MKYNLLPYYLVLLILIIFSITKGYEIYLSYIQLNQVKSNDLSLSEVNLKLENKTAEIDSLNELINEIKIGIPSRITESKFIEKIQNILNDSNAKILVFKPDVVVDKGIKQYDIECLVDYDNSYKAVRSIELSNDLMTISKFNVKNVSNTNQLHIQLKVKVYSLGL